MKFIAFVLSLLHIAGCTHVSTTSTPVNIDGMWKGEYNSGMDGQPPIIFNFNFIRDGNSLTGFASQAINGPSHWIPLDNGKIKGGNINFTLSPSSKKGLREIRYKFIGKVEGDIIRLTFKTTIVGIPDKNRVGRGRRAMGEIGEGKTAGSMSDMMGTMFDIGAQDMSAASASSQEFTIERVKY